jgi:alpha-D-xyloside xylohydrolase
MWHDEIPDDPMEIRIYPGHDGAFTLYEDAGDGYDYEKGQFTEIPFVWNDAAQSLTIGERSGAFEGMLRSRIFNVVLVKGDHGVGIEPATTPTRVIAYTGAEKVVTIH